MICCDIDVRMKPGGASGAANPIPVMRVRERLDILTGQKDYAAAARHLEYWLREAQAAGDLRGAFVVLNEMMGVYRKTGDRDRALESVDAAIAMISTLDNGDTISAGTAYVNAGTVCDRFGDPDGAIRHFEAAKRIYEANLDAGDERLGGLYNNMALALAETGRFDEAFRLYALAMDVMARQPYGQLEQAITCLNMANALEAQKGMEAAEEEIASYLDTAEGLLGDASLPRNGYYAFVCEKCAPTFSYYGWFQTAAELTDAAETIYRRNREGVQA